MNDLCHIKRRGHSWKLPTSKRMIWSPTRAGEPAPLSACAHIFTHSSLNDYLPESDNIIPEVGKLAFFNNKEAHLSNLFLSSKLQEIYKNYSPSNEWFPPFSLFREFMAWLNESGKQFSIIANQNSITYKEFFPLIKNNNLWLGATGFASDMVFRVPSGTYVKPEDKAKAAKLGYIGDYTRLGNSCWFTNIDHGRRHQPLQLMTMADNIKYSKHKEVKGVGYLKYENYDVLEVPAVDAIPSDYLGLMGVPITFLDKYCPEQFEIVSSSATAYEDIPDWRGVSKEFCDLYYQQGNKGQIQVGWPLPHYIDNGIAKIPYKRLFIRKK